MLEIVLKSIFGIPLVLFVPGYLLAGIIFPRKKKELSRVERVAISMGLSVAIVPLIVFSTNLLGVPIDELTLWLQLAILIAYLAIGYFWRNREDWEKLKGIFKRR